MSAQKILQNFNSEPKFLLVIPSSNQQGNSNFQRRKGDTIGYDP